MFAHQHIEVDPIARLGADGGNQRLGFEQFHELRDAWCSGRFPSQKFRLRGIRSEKGNFDLPIHDEILLVVVQLPATLEELVQGCFVVVTLEIESCLGGVLQRSQSLAQQPA